MSGRKIEKKALPTTGNLKPFEDNFFDRCFKRPLLLVSIRNDPEDKKRIHADPENHFHWQVIDPENGISYEAPFDPASEVVAAHKKRTDLSSVSEHYEIVGQNYPAKYYFNAERISDRFVFRIWRYHPIPKQEPQGLYESFRLVFYKAGCWMEGRDGRMTPFVPGMLYSTQWKMEIKQQEKEIQSQKILLKDMEYEDEQYALSLPTTRQDIISEGTSLHHCVGSYASQVANGITTILFLRKKSCPKAPYLTVEIKNREITQCFGYHDSFNTDEKARIFLENYAQKKGYKIKCKI